MTDHLHILPRPRNPGHGLEKSVDGRRESQRCAEVIHSIETISGIHGDDIVLLGIVGLGHPGAVPSLIVAHGWCDLEVIEEVKGGAHRDGVIDAIAPVLDDIFLEELILLRGDRVA